MSIIACHHFSEHKEKKEKEISFWASFFAALPIFMIQINSCWSSYHGFGNACLLSEKLGILVKLCYKTYSI